MNLVKRFFRQLTDDVVCEGSFGCGGELIAAINVHLAHCRCDGCVSRSLMAGGGLSVLRHWKTESSRAPCSTC